MMEKQDKKEVKGRSPIIYISIIGFLILSLTVLTVTFLIIHHIDREAVPSVSNHVEENSSKDHSPPTRVPDDFNLNFKIPTEPSKDIAKRSAHHWRPRLRYRPQRVQPRYRPHDTFTNFRPKLYRPRYYPGYKRAPVTRSPVTNTPTAFTTPAGTTSIEELGPVTCFDNRPSDQGASRSRVSSRQQLDSNEAQGAPGRLQCRRVFYVLCDESSRRADAASRAEGVPEATRSSGVPGAPGPPGPSRSIRYPVADKSRAPGGPRGAVRAPGSSRSPYPSLPEGVTCELSKLGEGGPGGGDVGGGNCRRVPDIICS